MGSSPQAPVVADPNVVASNQQNLNTTAGQQSQQGSMVSQNTPTGSLTYSQTGTSSDGTPLYTATTALTPAQQGLLNTLQGTQQSAGTQGQNVITGANYGSVAPATAIGNATSGLTSQAMGQETAYLNPFFTQQTDQLDTKLKNEGFAPGQPGYDQAMNALKQSQGQTVTGFEASIEPQMYQQATSSYELPAQLAGSLAQLGAPSSPTFQSTPQLSIQPANLVGATANAQTAQQQTYQDQVNQNNAMMSGLFGIGTTALGVLGAPFTGGLSLGLLGASPLFGGTPGTSIGGSSGPTSYGGSSGPTPLV